jgi:Flp pilus assembly pilin Flp
MHTLMHWIQTRRGVDRERGAALTEYGLLLALIAAGAIIVLTALGDQIEAVFQQIVDALDV